MEILSLTKEGSQITDYSCTPACISFYLGRKGKSVTQHDLIQTCASNCSGAYAQEGGIDANVTNLQNMEKLASNHQFQVEAVVGSGIPDIVGEEAYLVLTSAPTNHCLIFFGHHTDGRRLLMNPGGRIPVLDQNGNPVTKNGETITDRIGLVEAWTDQDFSSRGCSFVKISL